MSLRISRSRLVALLLAAIAFLAVVVAISACGSDDLIFPGDIPFTATPESTNTPDDGN
jgi:hypothetical protein